MAISRLPVVLPTEEDEKELEEFLDDELSRQSENRAVLTRKIRDWEKQYESIHEGESNFPWPKSANPRVGLTQYHCDTIFSIIMNVLKVNRLPFSAQTYDQGLVPMLKGIEEFLQWAVENDKEINLYAAIEPAILEMIQIGTGILKNVWDIRRGIARFVKNVPSARILENAKAERERAGGRRMSRNAVLKDVDVTRVEITQRTIEVQRPLLTHVPLIDFWFPVGYRDLQEMPWVAERFRVFSRHALAGIAEDMQWEKERFDKVKESWKPAGEERPEMIETDKATGFREGMQDSVTFFEFWIEWSFKTDPVTRKRNKKGLGPQRYIVWHQPDTRTILGLSPHPYNHGEWPYIDFHYQRRKGKFLSRGLCPMLESDEYEINAIHKQRRDAATAANTVIVKANKNAGLTVENSTVWPMKVVLLEDPARDLQMEVIGRALNLRDLLDEEKTVRDGAGTKTGLTDFNFGKDMGNIGKGRASATAIMAGLRENLRRFSKVLDNTRTSISKIGQQDLELYQQHAPFGKFFTVLGARGEAIEEFFFLPQAPMRGRLFIKCNVTTENMNEEVRRQAILLTTNMLDKYYKGMTELVTLIANPNAPPEVKQMAMRTSRGMSVMTEEFLEAFGIRRKDELLLDLPESINDLSPEAATQILKQLVNQAKAKGAAIELIDTTEQPQPPAPAALPTSPVPLPQAGAQAPQGGPQPGAAPPPVPAGPPIQ